MSTKPSKTRTIAQNPFKSSEVSRRNRLDFWTPTGRWRHPMF